MYNDDFRVVVERQIKRKVLPAWYQVMNPELENPYTMHYTLGVQRELAFRSGDRDIVCWSAGRKFLLNRVPTSRIG
jgi:hypothetical protein